MERKHSFPLLIPFLTMVCAACSAAENGAVAIDYPETARSPVVTDYHGTSVADPYQWLEDLESQETKAWAAQQNELTEDFVGRERIDHRRQRLSRYNDIQTVRQYSVHGGNAFYLRGWVGAFTASLFVERDGERRRLAGPDLDAAGPSGKTDSTVAFFWPSDDGARVAAISQAQGSPWGRLEVIDVESGDVQLTVADHVRIGVSGVNWSPAGDRLYIVQFDPAESSGSPVNARLVEFDVQSGKSRTVFGVPDGIDPASAMMTASTTRDGESLIVGVREGSVTHNRIYALDLTDADAAPRRLFDSAAIWTYLGSHGDELFFYTDADAPNGRVVATTLKDSTRLRVVVPESESSITANSLVGGNVFGMFGKRIALGYLVAGRTIVKGFNLDGREVYAFDVPATGAIWGQLNGDVDTDDFYYGFLGVSEPGSTYRVDSAGKRQRVVAADTPFDPDSVTARRVYVERDDGVRVPVIVAHRAGLEFDRPRPTILYGYGAYGWVSFLWYQAHLMEWFANDGVYVIAGIRGGGEYGTAWHEAGRSVNRQVAIDDYLAASRWLVDEGISSTALLVANGGSMSGPLATAAYVQRPDLYGAAVIDFPIIDVLRYVHYGTARFRTGELGDPTKADEFAALYAYSPYHAMREERCLPPLLMRTGEFDTVTSPAHGFKSVAAAQRSQTCSSPVLLDVMEGAGHDYGTNPDQTGQSHSVAIEFLMRMLPYDPWRG